ncbi:MAG: nucleoside-diphosphate sugar epimerase, partial [Nitrospinota bacterium]
EISILALARRVKELTGSPSPIKHISYEEAYGEGFEDMERRVPNLEKISSTIGYRPEVDLDETLRQVIEYFRG